MSNQKKWKAGETAFYLGRIKCTVLSNTLKPGGINVDEALIFLQSAQGSSVVVPVEHQEKFLAEKQLPLFKTWPLKA